MAKQRKKRSRKRQRPRVSASAPVQPAKTGPLPISLCMIVKNEEHFLEDCLKSVRDLVAEIVIVDTGSTDRTLKIASNFGARIFSYKWDDDFSAARNLGLKQAKNPWILYLDADERLHAAYHDVIRQAIASGSADAYYLNVRSAVRGVLGNAPHVQSYPRLFRKIPGVKFVGRVHEQITPSLQAHQAKFTILPVEIEHLGYAQSDEILKKKIERNLQYLRRQVAEEPGNPYALFQLGQTCILAGEDAEGERLLRKVLENKNLTTPLWATTMLILANEAFKREAYREALDFIDPALHKAPRQRLGWFLKSECLGKLENWKEALAALTELKKHQHRRFTDLSLDKIFADYLIAQRMGLYHFCLEDYANAVQNFEFYLTTAPKPLRVTILKQYLAARKKCSLDEDALQPGDILNTLNRLADFDDVEDAIRFLASYAEELQNYPLQKEVFERANGLFPDEAMYIYYLGNAYLNLGAYPEAEKCYEQAERLSPTTYEIYFNRGVAAIRQEHYRDAIDSFQKIRHQFPEYAPMATKKLAGLYAKIGEPEKAVQVLMGAMP